MRPYEVMVIFDTDASDDAVGAVLERTSRTIEGGGGVVSRVDRWGRRRLAYEIHHKSEGNYVLVELLAENQPLFELDRLLLLADEVLRHKIIRLPEEVAGRGTRPAPADEPATERRGATT